MDNKKIKVKKKTMLLGTVITNDLKWEENTGLFVKRANTRMQLLRKCSTFTTNQDEIKNIYILFVRSILKQSCVVWHRSLTIEDSNDLKKVKNVLPSKYFERGILRI